jgi:predicted GNAT superfamily acetyltransferase
MKARLIDDKEKGMVEAILKMEGLFPQKIGYGEWDVWDNLQNLNNMNLIVEDDGEIIGYVLCIPQKEAIGYLKNDDPLMQDCHEMCYVDQIAIVEDKRGRAVFTFILDNLAVEAEKRGFKRWSTHIMAGLEGALKQALRGRTITEERKTRMSSYGNYDLVYMEGWI